jgi:hypothetical protein
MRKQLSIRWARKIEASLLISLIIEVASLLINVQVESFFLHYKTELLESGALEDVSWWCGSQVR